MEKPHAPSRLFSTHTWDRFFAHSQVWVEILELTKKGLSSRSTLFPCKNLKIILVSQSLLARRTRQPVCGPQDAVCLRYC